MNKSAIYIHVPWCRRRCPYCDFYFEVGKPKDAYVESLIKEWRLRGSELGENIAHSLYFGGGTPSLLSASELASIVSFFRKEGALHGDAEITIEANPEDLSNEYIDGLSKTWVNRISLGVQSFDDSVLRTLGRMHSESQAKSAIENLKKAGFNNISVDLITGVPGENTKKILQDLEYISDLKLPHISSYLLTIEQKTNFYRRIKKGLMVEPSEDQQVDIFRTIQGQLREYGYEQYDISSYAKEGRFSRHNQIYWSMGAYLGLGPGAHSMSYLPDQRRRRTQNKARLSHWLSDPCAKEHFVFEDLSPHEAFLESLSFGLRNMVKGVCPQKLAQRFKSRVKDQTYESLEKMVNYGWLEREDGIYKITFEGALFADAVMREILCP